MSDRYVIGKLYQYVWCSNCARQFHFPLGNLGGFSHCDNHAHVHPLPENQEVYDD